MHLCFLMSPLENLDATRLDVARFLDRLGFREPEAPSARTLHALHRAFVERIPYETIEIQPIDQEAE
jgi:arylamine N-acetyltransferase